MNIITTSDFERVFEELPKDIQRLYRMQKERFLENWRDIRLHIKKVKGLPDVFSFRITRQHRVIFYFHHVNIIVFFEVDHRKDAYR